MKLTKAQIILISGGLVVVLLLVLVFTGVIPGLRTDGNNRGFSGQLIVWGVFDSQKTFNETLVGGFFPSNPNVEIIYRKMDFATYETELINALAAGVGPDIFMIHNSQNHLLYIRLNLYHFSDTCLYNFLDLRLVI